MTDTYNTANSIKSDRIISSPNDRIFNSPQLELLKGFTIHSGMLEIQTDGCIE
jgi:hypothetical protein